MELTYLAQESSFKVGKGLLSRLIIESAYWKVVGIIKKYSALSSIVLSMDEKSSIRFQIGTA